jgi:hypothetical protein
LGRQKKVSIFLAPKHQTEASLSYDVADSSIADTVSCGSRFCGAANRREVASCREVFGNAIMWHTSRGDRTLNGDEADLVSRAIEVMVAALLMHVDDDFEDAAMDCVSGIAVYDGCTPAQRIGLLHDVAKYLLTETNDPLPLSALTDATVAAIFIEIRDQIAIEIGLGEELAEEDQPTWRKMVLAAHRAVFPSRADQEDIAGNDGIVASSRDLRNWEVMVEDLADSILWDRDFEMAEVFLDIDPGVSRHRRRLLGIDDNYFTMVAPDPRPHEAFRLASRTRDIIRAKPR